MAAAKLTPEAIAKRKAHILEVLARSPEITKNHFKKVFGYDVTWLASLEAEGIAFGKPVRHNLSLKRRAA